MGLSNDILDNPFDFYYSNRNSYNSLRSGLGTLEGSVYL